MINHIYTDASSIMISRSADQQINSAILALKLKLRICILLASLQPDKLYKYLTFNKQLMLLLTYKNDIFGSVNII